MYLLYEFYGFSFHFICSSSVFKFSLKLLIFYCTIIIVITFPIIGTVVTLTIWCSAGRCNDAIIIGIAIYPQALHIETPHLYL